MIYRLHLETDENGSEGFEFFATRRAAERARAEHHRQGYEALEIDNALTPTTKADVVELLESWAGHEMNG